MEKAEESKYEVAFTASSRIFYYELLEYLYKHLTVARAEEVSTEILEKALSLNVLYERGSPEPRLKDRPQGYRYLLYERTQRKHIKIIYYVDHKAKNVYVTDFFPTEMDDKKIANRS